MEAPVALAADSAVRVGADLAEVAVEVVVALAAVALAACEGACRTPAASTL